jgi:D-alanine-D-alanine ligase
MNKRLKISIISGGPSLEHDVSLKSGRGIFENLDRNFYEPKIITIAKTGEWPLNFENLKNNTDIAFLAMHGNYGEDGVIQSELDALKIPYTGSSAIASSLGMNKYFSGLLFKRHGLEIPYTLLFSKSEWRHNPAGLLKKIIWHIPAPWIIKPNRSGSSIGVSVNERQDQLAKNIADLFLGTDEILAQPFIRGREITCGVLDHGAPNSAYPLIPLEIILPENSKFDDYNAKYNEVGGSLALAPARLSSSLFEGVRRAAVKAHRAIGARCMSRADMIVGRDGRIYVLEINTIPGFTKTSLLPKSAAAHSIEFPELLNRIIKAAVIAVPVSNNLTA